MSSIYIKTIPLVIGLASGLYLITQRWTLGKVNTDQWGFTARTRHVLELCTVVGLAGMVFVGTYTGGRTVPFFLVSSVVCVLIFMQIFFLDENTLSPLSVLAQLLALAFILRGVALATTPGFIGIDSWTHITNYASAIRQEGRLAAIADVKYYTSPLYHLLVVAAAETFNSTLRTALYASLGVVMPLVVFLLYYTTRLVLSIRWALFATAAYSVADQVIRWGLHIIPTSMGLVFFLGVCYGTGKIYETEHPVWMYVLTAFFGIATILTHQVSTFILLLFLGAGTVVQLYFLIIPTKTGPLNPSFGEKYVNFSGLFLFLLPLTVIDWTISPGSGPSFVEGMMGLSRRSISNMGFLKTASATTTDTDTIGSLVTTVPFWVNAHDIVGFLLLLLLSLIGSFMLLRRKHFELLPLSWIAATGLMLLVTLGMPLFGLYFLVPMRWYAFMYVLMVILAAYGLRHLELNVSARHFAVILLVVVVLYSGPMISDHTATRDGPITEKYYHRFAFSNAEIDAAETISTIHPADATIYTDQPYRLLYRDWQQVSTDPLSLSEAGTTTNDYVVYRSYQTEAGPQVLFKDSYVRVQLPAENVCRPSMDVVYTNGDVQYCQTNTPSSNK